MEKSFWGIALVLLIGGVCLAQADDQVSVLPHPLNLVPPTFTARST